MEGAANTSSMVGFGVGGVWPSPSPSSSSSQHHGMMMMMMPPPSSTHHGHGHGHGNGHSHDDDDDDDDTPLPPLPPSTANFMGGVTAAGDGSSVAHSTGYYFMNPNTAAAAAAAADGATGNASSIKAKIMGHPHYPRLLSAYVNCQKVGAPVEVVRRLEEAAEAVGVGRARGGGFIGEDPALDQFMEAYCEMLTKYEQELTKPFKEAMVFLSKIESQFKALSLSTSSSSLNSSPSAYGEMVERTGTPEEEINMNANFVDPQVEDKELKCQLLRKYSGYLGSLKQEFMKKRKKGKLPKEARQQLLDWWTRHYKWPYPSESQKLALAEATGLDQKQINNWFINQRKRHWKPSEDMQFVVMDATHHHPHPHPHPHPHMFMEGVLGNPYPMDIHPALL